MMKTKIPMYIAVRLECGFGDNARSVWLPLPATKKEFAAALKAIDTDFGDLGIVDYNVRVPGLYRELLLEAPLGKVNLLASRLAALNEEQVAKLAAVIDSDRYFIELDQFIDYTYTHHRYALLPGVRCAADLGRVMLNSEKFASVPAGIRDCIDTGILGQKIALVQDGQFTALGYLTSENDWSAAPRKRKIPAALNLTGLFGQDLYGEWAEDYSELDTDEYGEE